MSWIRKRDHNLLTNAASLLICGLLAGIVVAAAAFPVVAMTGLAAKAGAETFDKLPAALKVKQSPQISYVYARDGKTLLAMMYDENRRDTKLKNVAPVMIKAIIAAEDHDFYRHNGVDVTGVARAFVANKGAGRTQQGASTLTMQYVRLAISYSAEHPAEVVAATEDTNKRKLQEMRFALAIEQELAKDEILERYLNIAPFGNGAYGIFAASQVYFNKLPKDLNLEEAALLAGLVKAPTLYNPATRSGHPRAVDRRAYVLNQMVQTGAITREQAAEAKAKKLVVKGKRTPRGCVATKVNHWGFFCDYFYRWWMDQRTFGATTYDRERMLKSGGYHIVTSLDVNMQAAFKKNVDKVIKTTNKNALMVAAIEPGTGRVRALAVNRVFKLDDPNNPQNRRSSNPDKRKLGIRGSYPNTTNPLMTGGSGITGYQVGSTFKIFTVAAALEKGYPLATTLRTRSPLRTEYIVEPGKPPACPGTNKYCPSNANPGWMDGTRTMWSGFGRSVNTYMVKLQEMIGAENAVNMAKRLGIQFRAVEDANFANNKQAANQWGAFTLGVSNTIPLELANAYATLAADGKYCQPTPVQEIRDQSGQKLAVGDPICEQRVSKEVARAAIDAARCPVNDRSETSRCDSDGGTAADVRGTVGRPVAGKTGTSDNDRTSTLVLTTKQLAVAGVMADPDWAKNTDKMDSIAVKAAISKGLRDATRGMKKVEFTPPSGKLVNGTQRSIPDVRCRSVDDATARLRGAGFDVDVVSTPVESSCPRGTVAGTEPEGSTIEGGVVVIRISSGQAAQPRQPGSRDRRGRLPGFPPPPGNNLAQCMNDPRACLDRNQPTR
ncbi:MAG TPA: penicillin-binding protein [Pilimelia sp.]|nr:penicillin-binding protein [Pilimelia sp.]